MNTVFYELLPPFFRINYVDKWSRDLAVGEGDVPCVDGKSMCQRSGTISANLSDRVLLQQVTLNEQEQQDDGQCHHNGCSQ